MPLTISCSGSSRQVRSVASGAMFTRKRNPGGSPSIAKRRMCGRALPITFSVMRLSKPAEVATDMNSCAGITRPVRGTQRASSSAPTTSPVDASISG